MAAEQTENKAAHVIHEKEEIGKVIISDEVFSLIAGLAAMEVEGVNSMAGNITRELVAKLAMKNLAKGVKVEVQDESVTVYMSLNIDFGKGAGAGKGLCGEHDRFSCRDCEYQDRRCYREPGSCLG